MPSVANISKVSNDDVLIVDEREAFQFFLVAAASTDDKRVKLAVSSQEVAYTLQQHFSIMSLPAPIFLLAFPREGTGDGAVA